MGNVNASAVKADALRPGDHIFIWDRTLWPFIYQHHGIVWKSGESVEDVQICHVWTPLEGFRQAQADSSFRVSTLEQFLYHRSLNDVRLVEYEGHTMSRPDVVLTRCRLLLGRGRGDYHPIIQNCEHAARWCKTGSQWSTQTLTRGHGTIPFEDQLRTADVLAMKHQVAVIERDTARKPVVDGVQQGLRVELQCRTLFWLDSFSAEND
ncbi:hypothetical protein P3T76_007355 [Phytophthora citrophthora]|uniref:LRAT domain-containing protein n=1 Tax=Phytophthora citrophthora TaxID=4793 RepID=A0AAD9GMC9_9STRA|nr:hypothetical protein P3T76_007355 [Phytophthora citrophthora]